MIQKIFRDKTLKLLIIINIINLIAYAIGGKFLNIKYISLIITFLILIFCKQKKSLPIVFYLHCNSALYDDINFTYIFNISIFILLIKEIFFYHSKFNKKTTILFIILLMYNICMMVINNLFSGYRILSMISWISSYLILIIYSSNKNVDFEIIYRYFFVGFIMSCLNAVIIPFKIWGTNIPTAYRFIGLLRDPNYYSFDALFLIFSSGTYARLINKNSFIYITIIAVLGILSVSKMFILLLITGFIFNFIFNLNKLKIKPYQIILTILMMVVLFVLIYNSNFIDIMISKYTYRSETTSLLTGRDKIQLYYLNFVYNNPLVLLFGQSTSYSAISDIGSYLGGFYANMVAHNTYIDFIMSWGILFTIFYLCFIYKILQMSHKTGNNTFTKETKVLVLIFLLGMFALSYLQADVFALLILYIILLSKNGDEVEINESNKNIHDNS